MRKCCNKTPVLQKYDIILRNNTDGVKYNAPVVFWYECPVCHYMNSYGYNTAKEAEKAWDNNIVAKRS